MTRRPQDSVPGPSTLEDRFPYSVLSAPLRSEALSATELRRLAAGERLPIGGETGVYVHALQGTVRLERAGGPGSRVVRAGEEALPALVLGPCVLVAETAAQVAVAGSPLLDGLVFWEAAARTSGVADGARRRYLDVLRHCPDFAGLAPPELWELFRRMRPQAVKAGEVVVAQGSRDDGRYFVLVEGSAEVWRRATGRSDAQYLRRLNPGDTFGEFALLSGEPRSATVRMREAGLVLVVNQEDFRSLVSSTLARGVKAGEVEALAAEGAVLLDVRYPDEQRGGVLPGASAVPLPELRERLSELDRGRRYVAYCWTGDRSSVATLVLRQRGFLAVYLEGGLRAWPDWFDRLRVAPT